MSSCQNTFDDKLKLTTNLNSMYSIDHFIQTVTKRPNFNTNRNHDSMKSSFKQTNQDILNKGSHTLFDWIQLIATISVPIAIGIGTIVLNSNSVTIASQNREKDQEIAVANQAKDEKIADDQRKENILIEYQNSIAKLLIDYGMTLNGSISAVFVVRVKTLTALKQLDPFRKAFLIQTIFEANLITTKFLPQPIVSLDSADLTNLDIGHKGVKYERLHYPCISFVAAILHNSSFHYNNLIGANFSNAYINFADFTETITAQVTLAHYCFPQSDNRWIDFENAKIENSNFKRVTYHNAVFNYANLFRCNLRESSWSGFTFIGANLSEKDLTKSVFTGPGSFMFSKFIMSTLFDVIFQLNIGFQHANFTGSNMNRIWLYQSGFYAAILVNCSLKDAKIDSSDFSWARMMDTSIIRANIQNSVFYYANLSGAAFSYSKCEKCIFSHADLSNGDFHAASFVMCNFTNATVSIVQLMQAASLSGSILPNGTRVSTAR